MIQEDSCLDISDVELLTEEEQEVPIQVFHNLMPFKVREILLVSSLYDAFIVEEEGLISELVIGEYRHLLLSSPPRVTHVASGVNALSKVKSHKYDLVITMSKNIGMNPFTFGKKIKEECPDLPVIILATDAADLHFCQQNAGKEGIDKAFFWYGDTSLFMAIVKYVEDRTNAQFDTKNGNVQVIILLEDSIRDYSMLMPVIYSEIVQQTQRSISEDLNEMQRLLRRRARPKILLVDNYEEGVELYKKYKNNILGIISDVKFPKEGKLNLYAGHEFIKFVKNNNPFVPTLLQSTNPENRRRAEELGAYFIHKNSPNLMQEFNHFLLKHLGFGDFIFLLPKKEHKKGETDKKQHELAIEIRRASNLKEFEKNLQKIPLEAIRFHADRNDFSNWLMARGEFKLAMKLRPAKVTDFKTLDEMRGYLVSVFNESRRERHLGVMTEFGQQKFEFESSYTRIGSDSLGGKGRGIAFIRTLLSRHNLEEKYPDIHITIPSTVAIGTDEFDKFILENKLHKFAESTEKISDKEIAKQFLKGELSKDLKKKLSIVLKHFKKPLAVRSSSLLEDSQNYPFAGMYSTYLLPNNDENNEKRLEKLCQAIKLVYASVFYKDAKSYIESTSAKSEEEKMAIIIQELIGNDYNGKFYPTFSGVAQSYNYYPVSYLKRDQGIVSIAVGLGNAVVGGEKVLRFSPYHPDVIPEFSTPGLIMENTQRELYVLNTKKQQTSISEIEKSTLEKISIADIANDGTLNYIASSYEKDDGMIRDSFSPNGPHLITFAGILKFDVFPLTSIIKDIIETGQESMGCPVEIEFAVNFDPEHKKTPTFAIIQIRPIVISQEQSQVNWDVKELKKEEIFIRSDKALGNGVINNIRDIVYVKPDVFDSAKTVEIAREIGEINKSFSEKPDSYVLIGPGRWGTRDRWLGIPVVWSEISNVGVMIETVLEDFNIKPTQGTHFFQNIVSRGIGYINTTLKTKESFIDWEWLKNQKAVKETKYVKHIHFSDTLTIKLDGHSGRALILKPS